jgi:hypothetical protein
VPKDNVKMKVTQLWVTWRMRAAIALALILVTAVLIWVGYWQPGTGFHGYYTFDGKWQPAKTFWDWMDLLVVPFVLGMVALWFTWVTNQRQREIELDRLREDSLQSYFDRMVDLLKEELSDSKADDVKPDIARARTLTVLRQLDGDRKGLLLQFLYEAGLIGGKTKEKEHAKGIEVSLFGADLSKADLRGADLQGADLSYADLTEADLYCADRRWANLFGAILRGADLTGADLQEATVGVVTKDQLVQVKPLKGATMPNGTVHE